MVSLQEEIGLSTGLTFVQIRMEYPVFSQCLDLKHKPKLRDAVWRLK